MSEGYDYFMVYELEDSGERNRLTVEEANLQDILHPEQVLVIVKEELRRIFIWKGAKSPVRKRFISSRVASALQEELVKSAAYHRCKIVSVDQGDEPTEFLSTFNLESMEVTERMADMRYIRNIEREKMVDAGIVPEQPKSTPVAKKEEDYYSPALEELKQAGQKVNIPTVAPTQPKPVPKTVPTKRIPPLPEQTKTYIPYPSKPKTSEVISDTQKEQIMKKIIKTEVSNDNKRINLILGHTLYGAVSRKVSVFGKEVEETEWEPVSHVPEKMIELDNHVLRIYFDEKKGIVEAVEILEKGENGENTTQKSKSSKKKEVHIERSDYEKMTVKELKHFCSDHNIEIPSGSKKAEIIELIIQSKNKSKKRGSLPKIPKD